MVDRNIDPRDGGDTEAGPGPNLDQPGTEGPGPNIDGPGPGIDDPDTEGPGPNVDDDPSG